MPKNSAEPEAIRAKYQQLIERIDALFARIPGGLSVATEAKHGRRARRWRTAMYSVIGLLVLCAIAWLAGPLLALPEWIVTYARSAAALAATIVFALALLMLRRGAAAPQTSTAGLRIALARAVRRARKFEKARAEHLSPALIAEIRGRHAKLGPPPRHLDVRANSLADRLSELLNSMPADGSDTIDEYVFNGRALAFWRPIFLFGCWAFLIELVIFVGTLTFPNGAGDAVTSTPVVSALFSALSPLQPFWELFWAPLAALFAALVVLSLVSKIFYRDFSADGERAVQLYRLTREIDDLERELEPFDPTERARIRAAIKFASTAPPKVGAWVIELKAGLRKAMNDAQRRAFIQVVFGGCLALLGLLGLAALLYDTYQEYLKIAPGCGDGGCAAELNAVAAWRQELFLSLTTSKLLLALGGNGLSFFFLAGFRKSQADARYFRNELTTVEMREWAITESKASVPQPTDATVLVDILGRLGRADRNPIIPPGGSNGHILELRAMNDELRAILQAIRNRNQQGDASGAPA